MRFTSWPYVHFVYISNQILLFFIDLHGAIGIKAYSPGQDGKRSLKVKSFVPEQYSDLVAKSARY